LGEGRKLGAATQPISCKKYPYMVISADAGVGDLRGKDEKGPCVGKGNCSKEKPLCTSCAWLFRWIFAGEKGGRRWGGIGQERDPVEKKGGKLTFPTLSFTL